MERKTVTFSTKIEPIKQLNAGFTLCKCYICALDKNRNLSFIGREAADAAQASLYNIPVIGHLYQDADGKYRFGGHDMTIAENSDGDLEFKSLCTPFGVVPSEDISQIHYEDVCEQATGEVRTYVVGNIILWTGRFPELLEAGADDSDKIYNQSMEIDVCDYKPLDDDKNYTNILSYTYSALCLLNRSTNASENVEPCFPEASVRSYSCDDKFTELFNQMKGELAACFANDADGKEEKKNMTNEIRDAILAEFNITLDELDFEITEDMTEDDFRAKVDEFACKKKKTKKCSADPAPSGEGEGGTPAEPAAVVYTYRERLEAIRRVLPCTNDIDYWLSDYDDNFAFVTRYECSGNGDYSEAHGRFAYTYDESAKIATLTSEFERLIVRRLTEDESNKLNAMTSDYALLKQYKADREAKDRELAYSEVLNGFADIATSEEFAKIVEHKNDYPDIEALKKDCFALRGMLASPPPVHKAQKETTVPVGTPKQPVGLFDEFLATYGRK